ncbi:putative ATP-dependent endonuclease of OLD family [Alteromonas sp. 76-1]|uniref:ATP-dependent nuclease n=1 Tax=Alteromonas sp. 76-1 TaxID=2358187 RepID=UPI000FD169C9|nr:AAA family ATPase [Alteromonas sp. 76-1]VEL97242.1 putative ATP-dependent endonuclease of OLD family [Alteromonas sp. 76-1]
MKIDNVKLVGFRNFKDISVRFNDRTLIIGSNDVGKTNLLYALRLLLDKSLSDRDIEPVLTDFYINRDGEQSGSFTINIYFSKVTEDAVLSILKGHVSDNGTCVISMVADRATLEYQIYIGCSEDELELVQSRFYLKRLNLRYVRSRRDLEKFINIEKKKLLKQSQDNLEEADFAADQVEMKVISEQLGQVNEKVAGLNYVKDATSIVNEELKKLSHTNGDYSVHLDTGAIKVNQFIDNLELGASTSGSKIMLGGDGRNNQILLALWKAKSQREFDPVHEVTFYCVEEPEAHLHPHQQRKLADYLINELPGQTIITSHSPQITERYKPDSIIRLFSSAEGSKAAKDGCSHCISDAWDELGYRMSILPAEAFFASCVFLVEGPSEKLFYEELATQLGFDLDFYNITILCVDGIQFKVYCQILDAMEIPWVLRTDNDVSGTKGRPDKRAVGFNRCFSLMGLPNAPYYPANTSSQDLVDNGAWQNTSNQVNPNGMFLSKIDLENDIALELEAELLAFADVEDVQDAIKYLQGKKAIRMREFISQNRGAFVNLDNGELAKPLVFAVAQAITKHG